MRIVRFVMLTATLWEDEPWPDAHVPSWGLLVDQIVYPLADAPYAAPLLDGTHAPQIVGAALALSEVKLVAPVTPSKIVCVGRNYAEHAAELGNEVPGEPLLFFKPPSSLLAPGDAVVYPAISTRVDHEGELAVVIGRRCRSLTEAEAASAIFGYTVANDVTARDIQKSDSQWTRGKGFDTFCPVGPWIDTAFTPEGRTVRCMVNGEVRQEGNTDLMIFSIGHILAYITRTMTLEPGDLVLTGTPSGVGPVTPGDVMTVEVAGLGVIANPVMAESGGNPLT